MAGRFFTESLGKPMGDGNVGLDAVVCVCVCAHVCTDAVLSRVISEDSVFVAGGGSRPVHCRAFSILPGLSPLCTSSISPLPPLATTPNVSKLCSMSCGGPGPLELRAAGAGGRQGQGAVLGDGYSFRSQDSDPNKLH